MTNPPQAPKISRRESSCGTIKRSWDHVRGNFRDAHEIINARRHGRPTDETDRFPAFSQNINYAEYPIGFNPANMQNLKKYDGKQDPRQWFRI